MNRRRLVVLSILTVATAGQLASIAGAEETVYYEETFENESVGSVVHQTDFESGSNGWRGWLGVYIGSELDENDRRVGSRLQTTGRATVDSTWNRYHLYQRRYIEIAEPGTYHLYVRADAGFPDEQFDDEVQHDRIKVDGHKLSLDHGRETHHSVDLSAGNYSFLREAQYADADGGRANGTLTLDRVVLLRDSRRRVGPWESDGFPLYTDAAIDGTSLFARSVTASIDANPAQERDPVVVEFDVQTGSDDANWSIEQSGHRIADGSVDAGHRRHVRRPIDLQSGRFSLEIGSRDTVAIDNVRVVGYDRSDANSQRRPTVPIVDRAAPERGYETLLRSLDGIVDLGLDTATYLALAGIAGGSVLFVVGRRRNDRGLVLVVGSVALLLSVLVFSPVLSTVSWVFTGDSDHPSLADSDLSATSVLYRDDFEAGTLAESDWRRVAGRPSDAYLDAGEDGNARLVLREGAVVEATVSIADVGVDHGTVSIDSRVESTVGQAPPDEDALALTLESGGSTLLEEPSATVATGGDTVEGTLRRRVALSGSDLTIRIGARDTNGGDDRARITVSRVRLGGTP
jgi:hypothetical protein